MKPETTRTINDTSKSQYLYIAIELSYKIWKLGFTVELGQSPRLREVEARHLTALTKEIRMAKERFGLTGNAPEVCCYEVGRDGFWLHRYMLTLGILTWWWIRPASKSNVANGEQRQTGWMLGNC